MTAVHATAPARAPAAAAAAPRAVAEREPERAADSPTLTAVPTGWSLAALPVSPPPPNGDGGTVGGGRPLDTPTRRVMEARFGYDFAAVRVHDDARAAAAAAERRARAFTVGSDVVFAKGQYSPESPRGRWLLAHELAHVAQTGRPNGDGATPAVERDASDAATDALRGRPVRLRTRRRADAVHLFGEPDHPPDLTFVSTSGEQGFLDQAVQYHRTWGLAPRRFNSMQQLLSLLAQDHGNIARLRIVSHANFDNIFTPLFDGGSPGITEEDLRAYAESDVVGLRRTLGAPLFQDAAVSTQILDDARAANAAAFQPFGIAQAGSQPTGAAALLVQASIDRLAVATATGGIPQAQRQTLLAAIDTELAGLRTQVQQAAPTGAGVTAAQAQDLQTAITGVTGFNFQFPAQPADFVTAVRVATAGLGAGFRANLDAVRARLTTASWIDIRGCRVGQRPAYLTATARFFGTAQAQPHVSGPDWWQSYPRLGFQTETDRGITARAGNADVQTALDHWAGVTGVRERLMWWLTFLGSVLAQESRRLATQPAGPLTPPSLAGGLRIDIDPFMLGLGGTMVPLPPLSEPGLGAGRPLGRPGLGLGTPTLTNPFIAIAQREIPKYTAPDGLLRYYLDAGLPLPVQEAANLENIFLLFKVGREREAINAWLASEWEPAAPGLPAAQAGDWQRNAIRQVEAVSDLDDRRRTLAMYVSPDPRYAEHIKTT